MKYFITIFSASLLFISCNKKAEDPKMFAPDTTNNPALVQKATIDNMDRNLMRTHRTALEALMNIPGGGPFPPHLLPAKDIKLISETDSTASYSFSSGSTGLKARVSMKKRITAQDTVWMVTGTEEIH